MPRLALAIPILLAASLNPNPATAQEPARLDPQVSRRALELKSEGERIVASIMSESLEPPQQGGGMHPSPLKSPVDNQVFQRGPAGLADIAIVLDPAVKDAKIVDITIQRNSNLNTPLGRYADGVLRGVPVGIHQISVQYTVGDMAQFSTINDVAVGDLWVLAGQSNMEGVGDLEGTRSRNPNGFGSGMMVVEGMVSGGRYPALFALGMDGRWNPAVEPLHWMVDSPDPVHSGDPATREERSRKEHATRTKGAGLGIPFAAAVQQATGVPIGLVACAHGGTSMAQWDPKLKDKGGDSLYGSMIRQVNLAGGRVAGVLWYQGESDSGDGEAALFEGAFRNLIAAARSDFHSPSLPFLYVQIGRFVVAGKDPKGWNRVQEIQRTFVESVPKTAVISVIDLELDDLIHVGTAGLKRAGARLAKIALRDVYGFPGATTPTLEGVSQPSPDRLVVSFRGVNREAATRPNAMAIPDRRGGLLPERHVAGFAIRDAEGKDLPLIYEAMVAPSGTAVVLKLGGPVPPGASLWYGGGLNPFCNLVDSADMAAPVFGPVSLDGLPSGR